MEQGLQFLKELKINPLRRDRFASSLEYKFNHSLDLLGRAATRESLQDCLCAIGLGLLNEANYTHLATSSQILAMRRLVTLVIESNEDREHRILFLKYIKKYIVRRL